ncbi:conserved hypothetical protein [Candidatus Nitrotoga sp. HW29]|uniref:phage holin family protein n=1 Tax=Candidatus Nitrotoga sp. HW29 TaxID=2886963 RepID=UPI001EF2605F|nr:phage holin family protein [Candidatus Nitrotoga sp. HW29]CAH1905840.1 conserved hypothetical protein [Candidatus Nitrotoga sp. HW29]
MFEKIKNAKQLGVIVRHRMGDYMELVPILMKIQWHYFSAQMMSYVVLFLLALLSLIFLGVAIIVSYWETPYRVASAWSVVALYALSACGVFLVNQSRVRPISPFETLRTELEKDAQLVKDTI